jgi:hypothetical protein
MWLCGRLFDIFKEKLNRKKMFLKLRNDQSQKVKVLQWVVMKHENPINVIEDCPFAICMDKNGEIGIYHIDELVEGFKDF